jgi:hypothetical protein
MGQKVRPLGSHWSRETIFGIAISFCTVLDAVAKSLLL